MNTTPPLRSTPTRIQPMATGPSRIFIFMIAVICFMLGVGFTVAGYTIFGKPKPSPILVTRPLAQRLAGVNPQGGLGLPRNNGNGGQGLVAGQGQGVAMGRGRRGGGAAGQLGGAAGANGGGRRGGGGGGAGAGGFGAGGGGRGGLAAQAQTLPAADPGADPAAADDQGVTDAAP